MAPVLVHIKRSKAIFLGVIITPIALFGLLFVMFAILTTAALNWISFFALLLFLVSGAGAAYYFGLALRQPVALRMDTKGISGYYVPPVEWQEITKIGSFDDHNKNGFLGFGLQDPIAFRDRQTPFGRFKSWSMGRSFGYHIAVPEVVLKDVTVQDLARQAKAFHAAATGSEDLNLT